MKRWNIRSIKLGFVSVMLTAGMGFSTGKANANFFDTLSDSLRSVSAEVEKAQNGLENVQLKLHEGRQQVDNADAKLAEERKKMDVIKADSKAVAADVKSIIKDVEDLAASVAGE